MLEIPYLNLDDALVMFLDRLKLWEDLDLEQIVVEDISKAIVVVESLVEFKKGESNLKVHISSPTKKTPEDFRRSRENLKCLDSLNCSKWI